MCVNSDASVSACLMDWNHKLIIGDAAKDNICNVWNGTNLRKMRMNHLLLKKDNYSTCNECGQLKYAVLDNIDEYREDILKRL